MNRPAVSVATPIATAQAGRAFLLSCGGTGGHLAPGIALAEAMVARGHRPRLLISEKLIDARLAAKYPALRFIPVPGSPLGGHPTVLARFFMSQSRGLAAGLRLVRAERPSAVVGFGGFTSASVILAAALRGVPVALHESNRVPGRAVRLLSRLATRVWLPPGITLPGRPADWPRLRAAGMPVRAEIVRLPRADAAARFGLDPDRPTVAVFGGSQGAGPLNDWARSAVQRLAAGGVQLICVTGPGKGEAARDVLSDHAGRPVSTVWIPFCDDVAALLSASDLVVARAGAGSLAEFARIGTPAVLVPYPHAADDHQRANASHFADQGAGLVLDQDHIADLTDLALSLVLNPARLAGFQLGLARLSVSSSPDSLLDDLESLLASAA